MYTEEAWLKYWKRFNEKYSLGYLIIKLYSIPVENIGFPSN